MLNIKNIFLTTSLALASLLSVGVLDRAAAATTTSEDLNRDSSQALRILYRTNPLPPKFPRRPGRF